MRKIMLLKLIGRLSIKLALMFVARGEYLDSNWLRENVARKGL